MALSVNPRACEPCLECDGYPNDFVPFEYRGGVLLRPDGSRHFAQGGNLRAFLDDEDVTDEVAEYDADHGIVVLYHVDEKGEHHFRHLADPTERPPHEYIACRYVRRGDVRVIDKVTGEAPVWDTEATVS